MSALTGINWRRLWLNIHLWIGIGLGILLVPLSVTGSILVWHDALDRVMHPSRYAVSAPEATLLPADYLKAGLEALGPDMQPASLRMPEEEGDPVVVAGRGKPAREGERPPMLSVYLDPPTAKVLDVVNFRSSFMGIMHDFHGNLMVPGVGRQIVGWLGVAMLISSLTGIWLWWPRNKSFKFAFSWRRTPKTTSNLHYTFGFWIAIPLAVLSFTGLYISFPQTMRAAVGMFTELPPQQQRGGGGPGGALAEPQMTPDAAIAAAQAEIPDGKLLALNFPAGANPAWRVQMIEAGETRNLTVDDKTGETKAQRGAGGGGRDPIAMLMRRIHDGGGMGLVWQTVIFIGGILPALLGVTGLMMWLRKRDNRKSVQDM